MADITHIFGGAHSPGDGERVDPPEVQLLDAMDGAGLDPDLTTVQLDGRVHRFNTNGRKGKTGWYIAFGDGVPAGKFGCWRADIEQTWRANVQRELTAAEQMAHTRRMEEAKRARDAEKAKAQEVAADTVEQIWERAQAATTDHPYLERKGIGVNGARVSGDGRLVVPMYDTSGALASLQYISHDGQKRFHMSGKTDGCFWIVGDPDDAKTIYVAEGFATAATISEQALAPCVVSYSAANLPAAAGMAKQVCPNADMVTVADNDEGGIGQRYAEQATATHGGTFVVPPDLGDANDYHLAGNDLVSLLKPPVDDWLVPAVEFSEQPMPIRWLIKHWIQQDALCMVHGPSGSGKSFMVLDWCMSIASGSGQWSGHKAKKGEVVYLAGEGHAGLRGRVKAWRQENGADPHLMHISRTGTDLNTPAGYQRVVENVRQLKEPPSLIVVDTVHRFMDGDENSAQDVKTMLDACAGLMDRFGCTVLLVHHTGVSEEAQHRARGSSAWRGALEIEVSVQPSKPGKPGAILQKKAKDSEEAAPVGFTIKSVELPGWLDDDGEQVTSAVMEYQEADGATADPLHKQKNIFLQAWLKAGKPFEGDVPELSRAALKRYLIDDLQRSESTAGKEMEPGGGRLIGILIDAGCIQRTQIGYAVIDPAWAEVMACIPLF